MSSGIFISYRRTGGLDTARNLRDRLTSLNYKVFFDLTSMREGKFNQQIFKEIEEADDFLLILSEGALDRCVEEQDWLRIEMQRAMLLKKNIIPVWKPTFKGFPPSLPNDIADIIHYDSVKLSDDYYDAFFQKLLARLKSQRVGNVDADPQYEFVKGQDSRFITLNEWLSKHLRFNLLRIAGWFYSINFFLGGIGLLIAYKYENDIGFLIGGIGVLVATPFLIYLASFMRRMRKKLSQSVSEVEQSKRSVKVSRNQLREIGLIQVGYAKVEILLPCKYLGIYRMDRNNYIVDTPEGKSLYNRKRKEIVGVGPYETIRKTKYKIECIGKNGIQLFSLDGYQRYD